MPDSSIPGRSGCFCWKESIIQSNCCRVATISPSIRNKALPSSSCWSQSAAIAWAHVPSSAYFDVDSFCVLSSIALGAHAIHRAAADGESKACNDSDMILYFCWLWCPRVRSGARGRALASLVRSFPPSRVWIVPVSPGCQFQVIPFCQLPDDVTAVVVHRLGDEGADGDLVRGLVAACPAPLLPASLAGAGEGVMPLEEPGVGLVELVESRKCSSGRESMKRKSSPYATALP